MASEKITCSYAVKAKSETRNTFFEIIWEIIKKNNFYEYTKFSTITIYTKSKNFFI